MPLDTEAAVAAACAVAAEQGIISTAPVVLSAHSNVLVHLRPWPVVARVMTGTIALHDDPARWLRREVEITRFLEATGLAVAPSEPIDPGPVCRDGLWMTFTALLVAQGEATLRDGAERLGEALRTLHEALAGFAGELGDATEVRADIERLRARLRPSPALSAARIAQLAPRLETVADRVFHTSLPVQPLHGDVGLSNFLRAGDRLVANDFEDTFRGPLHWDVASFAESLRFEGADDAFVDRALRAYGWDDRDALAPFIAAQEIYGEIWRAYDAQRRAAPPSPPG
jgi:hypothetical protein